VIYLKTELRKKCQQRDDLERQIEPKICRGKAHHESKVSLSKKAEEQPSHSGAQNSGGRSLDQRSSDGHIGEEEIGTGTSTNHK